jgi:hypothetical protein
MGTVYLVERGCPICHHDLKGNDELRYFCKDCNILFDHKDIHVLPEEYHDLDKIRQHEEEKIDLTPFKTSPTDKEKQFIDMPKEDAPLFPEKETPKKEEKKEEPKLPPPPEETPEIEEQIIEETKEEPKPVPKKKPEIKPGFELETEDKIIASSESDKLHAGNCRFVSNIHKTNRIYFASAAEGKLKGYELCVCLRRINALQRP